MGPRTKTGAAHWVGALAALLLAAGFLAPPAWLPAPQQQALGITLFALVLWTAQPVPVSWTSLAVLLLLPASGLLDFSQTFAPFAGSTIWLVFSGMVLSLVVSESGLGDRLARASLPLLAGGRLRLLLGLHAVGLAAAFLVPSGVVRVLLLMPVGTALIRALDPDGEDPALPPAVTLSILHGTYYGGAGILTGTVPNIIVAGQLEAVAGRVVYWGEWLLWMFPVLGALRTLLCLAVIWVLWGRHLQPVRERGPTRAAGASGPGERRALCLMLLGVALWASDVVHGFPPVFVGLALVLLAVTPGLGILAPGRLREVDFPFFFYLAALFGIGAVLDGTGFSGRLLSGVIAFLREAAGGGLDPHLVLTAAAVPLDFLMDIAAVGAVATPGLLEVGAEAGLGPLASAMSVAMATTVAFLPYQSAPFMVALGYGTVTPRQLAISMFVISALSLLLLSPLNVLYWHWAGLTWSPDR